MMHLEVGRRPKPGVIVQLLVAELKPQTAVPVTVESRS